MKLSLIVVGRVRGPLAPAVEEYERRAHRYFSLEVVEVKEQSSARSASPLEVMEEEGRRLLERVPAGHSLIALHRLGRGWSSEELAGYLSDQALHSSPGVTLVIGGAFGLSQTVLDRAAALLSLSAMTLPHELARLLLTEQLYRAGTIQRGEPYHKTLQR